MTSQTRQCDPLSLAEGCGKGFGEAVISTGHALRFEAAPRDFLTIKAGDDM